MTNFTFPEFGIISDMHKDAYGFRPRIAWSNYTDEQKQAYWENLQKSCELEFARQEEDEARRIKAFEALILRTMEHGAENRSTALRWIADGEIQDKSSQAHCEPGSYLCYSFGLPYGTYKKEIDDSFRAA